MILWGRLDASIKEFRTINYTNNCLEDKALSEKCNFLWESLKRLAWTIFGHPNGVTALNINKIADDKFTKIFLLLAILYGVIQPATVGAENPEEGAFAHKSVSWTDLTFRGSKNFLELTARIQLGAPAPLWDELSKQMGAKDTECSGMGKNIKCLAVETRVQGFLIFDEQYTEQVWFDAADGRAYRRIRWRKGDDSWVKIYRWTDRCVHRLEIRPGNPGEHKQPPTKWSQRTESFYPYPERVSGYTLISDPTLVFYILSALEPSRLQPSFEMCVFGRKQLHRLTFRYEGASTMEASFKLHAPSGVVRIESKLKPLVFSIEAQPLAPQNTEPEIFSLLGLQKDIRIYLDASRHLPIRISGTNTTLGKLVLELSDATLN